MNQEAYHSVFNDLILSKSKDWDSFEKELDDLLKIENDDYFKQHNSNMNNYMCFPEDYNVTKFYFRKDR